MKRIILFRFHKKPLVCKNRLTMLRHYNPGIEIYGLYGGKPTELKKARKYLKHDLIHIYSIAQKSDKWKWENSDLAVREWFKNYGYQIKFDTLHIIEWDLLLFDSLNNLYPSTDSQTLYLTALQKLSEVENNWDWTAKEPTKSKWQTFKKQISETYGLPDPIMVCLGPGPALPRHFLEAYSKTKPSQLVHDEIRLPIMARVLGFNLKNNGFRTKWDNPVEENMFNCNSVEININIIHKELSKSHGQRAFHPYRNIWKHNS